MNLTLTPPLFKALVYAVDVYGHHYGVSYDLRKRLNTGAVTGLFSPNDLDERTIIIDPYEYITLRECLVDYPSGSGTDATRVALPLILAVFDDLALPAAVETADGMSE